MLQRNDRPLLIWVMSLLLVVSFGLTACSSPEEGQEGEATEEVVEGEEAEGGGEEAEAGAEEADAAAEEAEEEDDKPQRRERSVSVSATPAERTSLVVPVIAEGVVRARHSAEIKFELAGRIMKVHVQEGQRVRHGQRLATLDDREYVLASEEARANTLDALGKLAVEENDFGEMNEVEQKALLDQVAELEAMQRRGEISREERRAREMDLGVAAVRDGAFRRELLEVRSGLAASRAAQQRADLNLERTILRAPFTGVVSGLTLNAGERIQVGQTLCTVVDDVDVEADIGVLESDLRALELGRPALVYIPALDITVPAAVDVISPSIDSASRTCQVLVRLRSDDGKIKPGMFVRASIAGEVHSDKLVVPREAILTRDGRPLLFRVEDERAKWVYVELGLRNDHVVEIARVVQGGPVDAGTLVVVDNHLTLTHDAQVKVRRTEPLVDPWAEFDLGINP
jgi:RND family efflux transporter MFP subunit